MRRATAFMLAGLTLWSMGVAVASSQVTAGDISFFTSYPIGVGGVDEFAVTVSPDGRHVYIAGGDHLAAFARDPGDGSLTWIQGLDDGVGGIEGIDGAAHPIAVSPDGDYLYVPGGRDDSIAIFSRNTANGLLTQVGIVTDQVGGVTGINQPRGVVISGDGEYLYAGAEGSVAVFDRDISTGQLTWSDAKFAPNLFNFFNLSLSPDGQSIFTAGRDRDFVTVYDRNDTTGQITQIQVLDGPYDGPINAKATPDGRFVYVTSQFSDSVSLFSRDPNTHQLSFVAEYPDNVDGFNYFNLAWDEVIIPMTDLMVTTAVHEDAMSVLSRDPTTGELTFERALRHGVDGVTGMDGPRNMAITPDRKNIYLTGQHLNTLVVFSLPGIGDLNKDGLVSAIDLGMMGAQWGGSGTPPFSADINGDGVVGAADLGLMGAFWPSASGSAALAGRAVIPLPSAGFAGLVIIVGIGLNRSRRRQV